MSEEPETERTMEHLAAFLGTWKGSGAGDYPTIDAFEYIEETEFRANGIEPMLVFEQRTWKGDDPADRSEPLHWETGFLRVAGAAAIEMVNAQNGERVEVMRGSLDTEKADCRMTLESTLLGNDDRLIQTRRTYAVRGDELTYTVEMATTRNRSLRLHLRASLARVG